MKDLITSNLPVKIIDLIERIENRSDPPMLFGSRKYFTDRARICFKNGYQLSIVRGSFTYGYEDGLFEIAPIDKDGYMDGGLLNIDGDDVEGWLTKEDVISKIIEMANKT